MKKIDWRREIPNFSLGFVGTVLSIAALMMCLSYGMIIAGFDSGIVKTTDYMYLPQFHLRIFVIVPFMIFLFWTVGIMLIKTARERDKNG